MNATGVKTCAERLLAEGLGNHADSVSLTSHRLSDRKAAMKEGEGPGRDRGDRSWGSSGRGRIDNVRHSRTSRGRNPKGPRHASSAASNQHPQWILCLP